MRVTVGLVEVCLLDRIQKQGDVTEVEPLFWLFLKAKIHDALQIGWHSLKIQRRLWARTKHEKISMSVARTRGETVQQRGAYPLARSNFEGNREGLHPVKRNLAGYQLPNHDSEAPHIHLFVVLLVANQLGGHPLKGKEET